MGRARLCWIGSLLAALSACDETPPAPDLPAAVEGATPLESPAPESPAPEPETSEPAPAPATFDPLLAPMASVRVVALHRDHWFPCGRIHSTGVIEVEDLESSEPKPHMLLIVSCPVDFGHRELLKVGQLLEVDRKSVAMRCREEPKYQT